MESDLVNEEFCSPQPISVIATGPALIDSCLAAELKGARKGKNLRLCRLYKFGELIVKPGVELDVSEGKTHKKSGVEYHFRFRKKLLAFIL
jgi:hypothetical protein